VLLNAGWRQRKNAMTDPFARWTFYIICTGLFVIVVVHFGKFVMHEVSPAERNCSAPASTK
jgi:hypothetical protein